jgi:hypothetical protein
MAGIFSLGAKKVLFPGAVFLVSVACQPQRQDRQSTDLSAFGGLAGKNAKAGVGWSNEKLELNQEYIAPDEARKHEEFSRIIRRFQTENASFNQGVKRGFHAKQLACVKGTFSVEKGLRDDLRVGIFQPGKSYEVLARFSQGLAHVLPDSKEDVKGLAIKVLDVDGPKLLSSKFPELNLPPSRSIDFTMTNVPTFGTKNATDFMGFAEALQRNKEKGFLLMHPIALQRLSSTLKHKIGDVAVESFWSGGAYRLGAQTMKYRVAPCAAVQEPPKGEVTPNYFHETFQQHISREAVCYKYFVQLQLDPYQQPIENPQEFWHESETPSIHVATVVFTKGQDLDKNDPVCERLTFHPWNTIEAHRPLGEVNRARLHIYAASSDERTKHQIQLDPSGPY